MKRILVATDFSMEAENAVQTAIPIARAFEATIVLLHVLEVSSSESFNDLNDTNNEKTVSESVHINENLKEAQENFTRSYALHGLNDIDVELEQYIRVGSPIKQIEECIENMLYLGVIKRSLSPWSSPVVLIKKKKTI